MDGDRRLRGSLHRRKVAIVPMHHRLIQLGDLDARYAIYMDPENDPFLNYDPMDTGSFRPIFEERIGAADTYLVFDESDVIATFALHRQKHRSAHVATLGSFAMHPTLGSESSRGRGEESGNGASQLVADGDVRALSASSWFCSFGLAQVPG